MKNNLESKIAKAVKGKHLTKRHEEEGWFGVEVAVADEVIRVTIHNYSADVKRMSKYLRGQGYQLLSVIQTSFEYCQDGREFWWAKRGE
jgi:hypothetical protein